jgi:hypothetical protein
MRARACLLLAALALAGCGAQASGHGTSDRAIAHRAVLRLTDLPHGWKRERGRGENGRSVCRLIQARNAASGTANSATFTRNRQQEAESAVYVYRDVATARREFGRLTNRGARRCYQAGEQAAVTATPHVKFLAAVVDTPRIGPLGDQRADVRVKVVYTDGGFPGGAVFDLEFVRAGRGVVVTFYSRLYHPLASELRRSATGATVRRLADGLADRT